MNAVRYALLGGGKRLRPLLAWHSCIAAGSSGERSLPACAALEMIHAFSLVHDDLPAMDNDELRRGRPTLHIHAGEAMAILTGDALMAMAFEHLTRCCEATLSAALVQELSTATNLMISGQVYDTLGGFGDTTPAEEQVRQIHANKTGALIRAACRMGAICAAGPDGPAVPSLTRFGGVVGLLFQIVDDLLDVESTTQQAGKRTGKDAQAGKLTYPGVLGVERSRQEVARLEAEAQSALQPLGEAADGLRELCQRLARRDR